MVSCYRFIFPFTLSKFATIHLNNSLAIIIMMPVDKDIKSLIVCFGDVNSQMKLQSFSKSLKRACYRICNRLKCVNFNPSMWPHHYHLPQLFHNWNIQISHISVECYDIVSKVYRIASMCDLIFSIISFFELVKSLFELEHAALFVSNAVSYASDVILMLYIIYII